MSIIWFDNFKFDNTAAAISPTTWGGMDAAGTNNVTSTYNKNGFSNSGLDLSITTSSASHGSYYVTKNNIVPNNINKAFSTFTGGVFAGFSVSQYPQSGTTALEPQLLSDMSKFDANAQISYSPEGSNMAVLYRDASGNGVIDLYVRNGLNNTYTFVNNIATIAGLVSGSNTTFMKFSNDGQYLYAYMNGTASAQYIFKRTSIGVNSFSQLSAPFSGVAISGNVTWATFFNDGAFCVATTSSPYLYFYTKSNDVWSRMSNPSTLPSTVPTAVGGASILGTNFVIVGYTSSPYVGVYTFDSVGSSPSSFSSLATTLSSGVTGIVNDIDASTNGMISLSFNGSPYLKTYNYITAKTITNSSTLPTGLGLVKLSYDGRFLLNVSQSKAFAPLTYKLVNNAWVNIANTISNVNVKKYSIKISNDDNFIGFTTTGTDTRTIYTFDNNINVIATLSSNDNGITNADNYNYVNSTARLSVTIRDEIINVRYYSPSSGFVACGYGVAGGEAGFTDSNFTNAYIEFGTSGNTLQLALNSTIYATGGGNTSNFGLSNTEYNTIYSSTAPTLPLSLTFKRDINVSSQTTLNCFISDAYIIDQSGTYNVNFLGPCTVDTQALQSDNVKQWGSSSGTTSYQLVGSNPPDPTKYVFSNVDGAYDYINVDSSSYSSATTYATRVNVKAKTMSPSSNTISVLDSDIISSPKSLTTDFANKDQYTDGKITYVAATTSSSSTPVVVYKLDTSTASFTQLNLNAPSISGRSVALSQDGADLMLGLNNAPYLQIYNRANNNYVLNSQTFSDIVNPVNIMAVSPNGKYLAVGITGTSTGFKVSLYKILVGGTYTKITEFATSAAISALKFSKGGKYLFVGTLSSSAVYVVDNVNDTFTVVSGQQTQAYTCIDTTITPGGVEYVVMGGNGSSPYIYLYKINNDNTFTAATTSNIGTIAQISTIAFVNTASTTQVTIMYDLNSASNRYTTVFTYSANSISAPTKLTNQPAPVIFAQSIPAIFNSSNFQSNYYYLSAGGTSILTSTSVNGTYASPITLPATVTGFYAVDIFNNSSKIGYRYNK